MIIHIIPPLMLIIIISIVAETNKLNFNIKALTMAILTAAYFICWGLKDIAIAIEENKKEDDE